MTINIDRRASQYIKCWGGRKIRKSTLRRLVMVAFLLVLASILTWRALQKETTWSQVIIEVIIGIVGLLTPIT